MGTRTIILGLCLLAAACGDKDPEPVGNAMREVDLTDAKGEGGRAVDPATMQARRIAGTWRGTNAGRRIEATFGSDGSLSMQIEGAEGIVDAATGDWRMDAGRLSGTSSGGTRDLARYVRWTAAFASDTTMNISGSDGAIMVVTRG